MSAALAVLNHLKQSGVRVSQLTADSREVRGGDVYLALAVEPSSRKDHIDEAIKRGAAAVLVDDEVGSRVGVGDTLRSKSSWGEVIITVKGLAALVGELAHEVYQHPSEKLWMVGITGTNGKTSVSQWLVSALTTLGQKCAVIGTLGNGFPGDLQASVFTTPQAHTVHAELARFIDQKAVACAMEVSSIGLDQGRVNGVQFDVAVLTNLTRDHLDYHGTMEDYMAAKCRLFDFPGLAAVVLNLDDPFGLVLAQQVRSRGKARTLGYTLSENLELDAVVDDLVRASDLHMSAKGIEFTLRGARISVPVVGRFNVSNILAVIASLLAKGEALPDIAQAVSGLTPPPGRMQIIEGDRHSQSAAPLIVVDYSHTPDALEKALRTLRETATGRQGRLLCVFGCGGDRDSGKRPQMGRIAETLADQVWVTSDNPRGEDPQAIVDAILTGMSQDSCHRVILDRDAAIRQAITQAASVDVILLAGKGHETYQEVCGVRHPFSDSESAQRALRERIAC